jgi:TPR repeat protein
VGATAWLIYQVPRRRASGSELPRQVRVGPATCSDVVACQLACDRGQVLACVDLGATLATGDALRRDEPRAAALFVRACDAGEPAGCVGAGRMYEYARGVARDEPRAYALYDRACAARSLTGCYNAALLLEAGRGVARDAARARALFERVCNGGAQTACAHLGDGRPR